MMTSSGNEKSHQVNGSVIRGEFHEEAGYHIPLVLKGIPFKLYFQVSSPTQKKNQLITSWGGVGEQLLNN